MFFAFNPIAISLGVFRIHWYGIILGTGALVGLFMAVREGKRFQIPSDFFMDLLLVGVPSSLIAARAYYVIFKFQDYKHHLWEIIAIWHGGIAIYGALIGALIAGVIYVRYKGYDFWKIVDICAPSLLAGQMIGRWGNFMNQEAHGDPVKESFLRNTLHLPHFIVQQMYIHGQYYQPTFLYESVLSFLGIIFLLLLRRKAKLLNGEIFFTYVIWYGVERFLVEGLRTDSLAFTGPTWLAHFLTTLWSPMQWLFGPPGIMYYGNIRVSQFLALILVIVGFLLIFVRRKFDLAQGWYTDPIKKTH